MDDLLQSYDLKRQIGSGGMATVFLGTHPMLNRDVAVKIVKGDNKEKTKRFGREASLSASLKQENLPTIYDYFVDGNKNHCLVMEFVDGVDVSEILKNRGKLPPVVCAMMMREVLRGLEHIHSKGIIHRDIKPSNVRLTTEGGIKLMDFGIAKEEGEAEHRNLTATGIIIGTPSYMSPEQATGDRLTVQSDLFSMGTMMYELLCGAKPFAAETNLALVTLIAQGRYVPLDEKIPGLPASLVRIVHRAMQKDTTRRYASAGQMIHDLNAFLRNLSQSDMTRHLLQFYRAVQAGPYAASDFDSILHEEEPTDPDPIRLSTRKSGRTWLWWSAAAAVLVLVGWAVLHGMGREEFGRVEVQLKSKDAEWLKHVRVFVNDVEESMGDARMSLRHFSRGRNTIRIRYPVTMQTFEWHILLNDIQERRSIVIAVDSLIAAYHRNAAVFSGVTNPAGARVFVDQVARGAVGKTPLAYSSDEFRYGSHDVFFEKEGFTSFGLNRSFLPQHTYVFSIELDSLKKK